MCGEGTKLSWLSRPSWHCHILLGPKHVKGLVLSLSCLQLDFGCSPVASQVWKELNLVNSHGWTLWGEGSASKFPVPSKVLHTIRLTDFSGSLDTHVFQTENPIPDLEKHFLVAWCWVSPRLGAPQLTKNHLPYCKLLVLSFTLAYASLLLIVRGSGNASRNWGA